MIIKITFDGEWGFAAFLKKQNLIWFFLIFFIVILNWGGRGGWGSEEA